MDVEAIRRRWFVGVGMADAVQRITWTQRDIAALLAALERAQQEIAEANRAVARYRDLVDVAYQALSAVANANLEKHGRWAQGLARSTAGTIDRQADAIDESGQAQRGQGR